MAGHSKWKNIKHQKAAADAKKAKKFTKLLKEITIAAKTGGDVSSNPHLKTLLAKANEMNMPKENYTRAIKRGLGEIAGNQYESYIYEGYCPHNVAVIVEMLSDNKNKAASEIRAAFNHNGGVLGDLGSVKWMFDKKGLIHATYHGATEDALLELLIDYDIDDIEISENEIEIICNMTHINEVTHKLQQEGYIIEESVVGYHPKSTAELDEAAEEKVMEFLSILEALDEVQHVYAAI